MFLRVFYLILFMFASQEANSQIVTNVRAELQGEKVLITYDLQGTGINTTCFVQVFCSANNYASPLKSVSGDVMGGVKPKSGAIIVWDYNKENLQNMENIDFRIIAQEEKSNYINEPKQTNNVKREENADPVLKPTSSFFKNSINNEILINGTALSINYERVFVKTDHFHLSGQMGVGWIPDNSVSVPFAVSSYIGGGKSFFASRIGYNFYSYSDEYEEGEGSYLTLLVGYKYQKRFIFKVFAGIAFAEESYVYTISGYDYAATESWNIPWGGISFGIAF